jgi:hypothetical protein
MIRISHRLVYMALTMTYLAIYFGLEKNCSGLVGRPALFSASRRKSFLVDRGSGPLLTKGSGRAIHKPRAEP